MMFANRGERACSSGPSPMRGWTSAKVGDARQAPARAEGAAHGQLEREQAEDRPPAGDERQGGQQADDELVGPGRASVDDVRSR
jgi:hypothetical protein